MRTVGWKPKLLPAVFVLLCLLTACGVPQTTPRPLPPANETVKQAAVETLPPEPTTPEERARQMTEKMTVEEKVGQMFLAHIPQEKAAETAAKYRLGGYILFADYFKNRTPEQVREELAACQAGQKTPMLMAVDEEGGGVNRISQFPQYRERPFASARWLYRNGGMERVAEDTKEKCGLLRSLGINLNLAPVCDISQNPDDYIYYRTLGKGAEETAEYVSCVVEAMQGSGVGCTLKHFPGYGGNADTHVGMAVDRRSRETLAEKDLLPFAAGIESGAGSVMVSHNIVTAMDEQYPASLSAEVHRVLREELAFGGVIITDDLTMEGIRQFAGEKEAAVLAVQAGNDLLCCSDFEVQLPAVLEAVERGEIDMQTIDAAVERILRWKMELGLIE